MYYNVTSLTPLSLCVQESTLVSAGSKASDLEVEASRVSAVLLVPMGLPKLAPGHPALAAVQATAGTAPNKASKAKANAKAALQHLASITSDGVNVVRRAAKATKAAPIAATKQAAAVAKDGARVVRRAAQAANAAPAVATKQVANIVGQIIKAATPRGRSAAVPRSAHQRSLRRLLARTVKPTASKTIGIIITESDMEPLMTTVQGTVITSSDANELALVPAPATPAAKPAKLSKAKALARKIFARKATKPVAAAAAPAAPATLEEPIVAAEPTATKPTATKIRAAFSRLGRCFSRPAVAA